MKNSIINTVSWMYSYTYFFYFMDTKESQQVYGYVALKAGNISNSFR